MDHLAVGLEEQSLAEQTPLRDLLPTKQRSPLCTIREGDGAEISPLVNTSHQGVSACMETAMMRRSKEQVRTELVISAGQSEGIFTADLGMGVLALPLLRDITHINITQTRTWILLPQMHVHNSIMLWARR